MGFLKFSNQAEPLPLGAPAPSVTALDQDRQLIAFADVYAQGTTLVYFYPKADTPGCTAEACSLRDSFAMLRDREEKKIQILGVSRDTPEAQKKFQKKYNLPFSLIADEEGEVARAFGVPLMPLIGLPRRQSFLIKEGKIAWSSFNAKTREAAEEVQQALAAL